MVGILFKATGVWFVIVIAAILNGIFREKVLLSLVGPELALPLSGILLSLLVLFVSFMLVSFLGSSKPRVMFVIGLFWITLTLSFEIIFGRFVVGKSWQEIMQVFNLLEGNLFVLVLIVTFIAPWMASKAKGIL